MKAKQHLRSLSCVFALLLVGSLLMGSTWQRPSWQRASASDSPLFRLSLLNSIARLEGRLTSFLGGAFRVLNVTTCVCPDACQETTDTNPCQSTVASPTCWSTECGSTCNTGCQTQDCMCNYTSVGYTCGPNPTACEGPYCPYPTLNPDHPACQMTVDTCEQ